MKIKLSTLRKIIREAIEEVATCECGGQMNQNTGCNQCGNTTYEIDETDNDHDKDGDTDFADIMIARRIASGQSKKDAIRASRKHNESFSKTK